ncbi:hypothetical protein VMCG_09714 [Cytospora schulzeri]|uniref:Uncharacterized protein n=1 Tax=Cytospora schulzeri TaxID=448051 RepID=A0A423VHB3_9PEZI|nr:hypothetical protein VMCG_09714 [Valsa malicola]
MVHHPSATDYGSQSRPALSLLLEIIMIRSRSHNVIMARFLDNLTLVLGDSPQMRAPCQLHKRVFIVKYTLECPTCLEDAIFQ